MKYLCQTLTHFQSAPFPWYIAGGWALDLAYGQQTREHEDVDVSCFRNDLPLIFHYFADWEKFIAISEEQMLLPVDSPSDIEPQRHELHFFHDDQKIEILLIEKADYEVIFRRDRRITYPFDRFTCQSPDGIPFVPPAWQLLFKAKHLRPKDQVDFSNHAPLLDDWEIKWLFHSLEVHLPGHPWGEWLRKEKQRRGVT